MVTKTTKQFVVPQFHLNRFCDADGRVWTYSADDGPLSRKPEDTAVEKSHIEPEDEKRFGDLENELRTIEGNAAPYWEELMAGKAMRGHARKSIASFIAAQYLRSPSVVLTQAIVNGARLLDMYGEIVRGNAPRSSTALEETSIDEAELLELKEVISDILEEPKKTYDFLAREYELRALDKLDMLATHFSEMSWFVGWSNNQHLVTSDCPVSCAWDPTTHASANDGFEFADGTPECIFPLSPDCVLVLNRGGMEEERIFEISKKAAREMNRLQAVYAHRHVYSSRRDIGIQKLCDKWIIR